VRILNTQREGVKTVYVIGETLEGWPRYELWVYSPTQIHHPYQFEVYVQDQDMRWRRIVLHTIPEKLLPFIMKAFSEVRRPDQMGAFSDPQAVQGVEEEMNPVLLREVEEALERGTLGGYSGVSGRWFYPGDPGWNYSGYLNELYNHVAGIQDSELQFRINQGRIYSQDRITQAILQVLRQVRGIG